MIYDWTLILVLPGLLLGLWAQARVKSTYQKYSKVGTQRGQSAAEAIGELLDQKNLGAIRIERTSGTLTDHYDPRTDTLRLSEGVYQSSSVAALGIAAHEAGHALQEAEEYPFLKLRSAAVPVVNFGSKLAWPLFLAGFIFSFSPLINVGLVLYALIVIFTLITLPVEFDASRRAVAMLTESGYVTQEEEKGVRSVLNAAALTYVAAFVSAALQLLRLYTMANSRRRD